MPQAAALNLNRGHSASVAADVFYLDSDPLPTHVASCGPRSGCAVGLGRLWRVDAVKADGYLPASRAADIIGVAVCDFDDLGGEGLAGLDLGGCRKWEKPA